MSAQTTWLRLLLRLFPRSFRELHGEDLLLALEDWRNDPSRRRFMPPIVSATGFLVRAALLERVRPTVTRTVTRDSGASALEKLIQDLRYTVRGLRQRPAFTAIALLTLALGVGANSAIFSIVHAVVLRPLPYPQPERLVSLLRTEADEPDHPRSMSQPDLEDIRREAQHLDSVAGYQPTSVVLTGGGSPEVATAATVDHGLLEVFGLAPLEGRDLTADDNVPNGERIVVLSSAFAQAQFGRSDGLLGSTLEIDSESHRIVGIAPPGFDFPRGAVMWLPAYNDTEGCGRGCHFFRGVARLAPTSPLPVAEQELALLARSLAATYPDDNSDKSFVLESLHVSLLGGAHRGLLILLASVGLVLLIAAANLASLQLARSSTRRSEISVRSALGASRVRLWSLLLLETLVLGLGGGLVGVLLGGATTRLIVAAAPEGVPRLEEASLDLTVLAYALCAALSTALIFAAGPCWRLARSAALTSQRTTASADSLRARNLLLTGEVALSLLLLIGAGLLLQTYRKVLDVDLGFQPERVSSFWVSLPETGYGQPEKVVSFFDRVTNELEALPGVDAVGGVLGLPFSGNTIGTSMQFADEPAPDDEGASIRLRVALPGHVEAMGMRLLEGRALEPGDRNGARPVALVNREFVRRLSQGQDPRGREIQLGVDFGFEELPRTIVGVVDDIRTEDLTGTTRPTVYVPQAQMASPWMSIVLRTQAEADWQAAAAAVQRVDPLLPLRRKDTMTEALQRERGPARFYFMLLAGFALLAVALALLGLYGVVAYLVSKRSREIAIRMAVGASTLRVTRELVGEGLRPVTAGVALGLLAALATTRFLQSLLYEVSPFDPWIYALGAVGLFFVALAATLVPARRAGRVAPATALQSD